MPTASGSGNAPVDPGAFAPPNFGQAMEALLNHEQQKQQFEAQGSIMKGDGDDDDQVIYENVEISLSPFALVNLWAMAILALCVNAVLVVRCMMKRKQYEVERDYAASDQEEMVETEVDF